MTEKAQPVAFWFFVYNMFLMIVTKMLPDLFWSKRSYIRKEVKSIAINATSIESLREWPFNKGHSKRIIGTCYSLSKFEHSKCLNLWFLCHIETWYLWPRDLCDIDFGSRILSPQYLYNGVISIDLTTNQIRVV